VGDRDAPPDAGRAQILPPLQHLEEHAFRLFVKAKQADQLLQDVVFCGTSEVQLDSILGEELTELHFFPLFGARLTCPVAHWSARSQRTGQLT
jgi:hypothetical protein